MKHMSVCHLKQSFCTTKIANLLLKTLARYAKVYWIEYIVPNKK